MKIIKFLVCAFVVLWDFVYGVEIMTPRTFILRKMALCENSGRKSIDFYTDFSPINKTHYRLSTNSTISIDLDNNINVQYILYTKENDKGSYTKIMDWNFKYCNMMNDFFPTYTDMVYTWANLPAGRRCPVRKKGTVIRAENALIPISPPEFLLPLIPKGEFKGDMKLYSKEGANKILETCITTLFEVKPDV